MATSIGASRLSGWRELRTQRIPQPGQSGIQWCGIFATGLDPGWCAGRLGHRQSRGRMSRSSPPAKGVAWVILASRRVAWSPFYHQQINDRPDEATGRRSRPSKDSAYAGMRLWSALEAFSYCYALDGGFFGVLQRCRCRSRRGWHPLWKETPPYLRYHHLLVRGSCPWTKRRSATMPLRTRLQSVYG